MKVCFLSSLHPPFDKRVFDKEAISLAAAGFEVFHVAPGNIGTQLNSGVLIKTYEKNIINTLRIYLAGRLAF